MHNKWDDFVVDFIPQIKCKLCAMCFVTNPPRSSYIYVYRSNKTITISQQLVKHVQTVVELFIRLLLKAIFIV